MPTNYTAAERAIMDEGRRELAAKKQQEPPPKRGMSFAEFVEKILELPIPPDAEVVAININPGDDQLGFVQSVDHSKAVLDDYPELLLLLCEMTHYQKVNKS